ncbi:MAG: hypothetical protein H7338_18170 [Candidatus Sericytochromatia bacterium]|nr:hypothetical protein [Candidatus Sericytochromatia bacterium]
MSLDILLTCQQPGEFHHRVRPLASALQTHLPAARLLLNVIGPSRLPIAAQAAALSLFDEIITDNIYRRIGYLGRLPATSGLAPRGLVVSLSDTTVHARAIGFRTDWPVVAYTETQQRDLFGIQRLLLSEQGQYVRQRSYGHRPEQLAVVGPLIVESVRPQQAPAAIRKQFGISLQAPLVGLMAGGQAKRLHVLLPLFLQTIDALDGRGVPATYVVPLAEGLQAEALSDALQGSGASLVRSETGEPVIVTAGGLRVRTLRPEWHADLFQAFDVALVGPGANTAELACLGVPMIAVCPPGWPLGGNLLGRARLWLGRLVGEAPVRPPLIAWPNRKAGRPITPEIMGTVGPDELAAVTADLLADGLKRREISLELRAVMGVVGAGRAAAEQIWSVARERYPELDGLWLDRTAQKPSL